MTDEELMKAMRMRLYQIACLRQVRETPYGCGLEPIPLAEQRLWADVMAEELLRQMQWVRSEALECVGGAAEDTYERIHKMKITLAPEGWQPS